MLQERQVSLFGGGADVVEHPVLHFDELVFEDHFEVAREFAVESVQVDHVALVDDEDLRGFERFDVEAAGLLGIEAVDVYDPVVLSGELKVVFFGVVVYGISAEAARYDEAIAAAHLAGLEEELFSFIAAFFYPGSEVVLLFRGEGYIGIKEGN